MPEAGIGNWLLPQSFAKAAPLIKADAMVFVKGRLSLREEDPKIIANEVVTLESVKAKYTKSILIDLMTAGLEMPSLEKLKRVLSRYPGQAPVYLGFSKPDGNRTIVAVGRDLTVEPHEGLVRDIEKIFGRDIVSFRT